MTEEANIKQQGSTAPQASLFAGATLNDAASKNEQEKLKVLNRSEFINALKKNFATTVRKVYINSLKREVGFREVTVLEQKQLSRIMIDNEQRKDIVYDAQCALIN